MGSVSIAEAKPRLSELVDRAADGEPFEITRRGKPVARIVPVTPKRQPIDAARLKALTEALPFQADGADLFIRRMRDEDRY